MRRLSSSPRSLHPHACRAAGLALATLATAGCAEVFGVEPPPALASTRGATPYDGASPGVTYVPRASVVELRAPAVIVVRAPGSTEPLVTVTCAVDRPRAAEAPSAWGRYRPSPYEQDEEATPVDDVGPVSSPPLPYKPSPYEDRPAPRLYHD